MKFLIAGGSGFIGQALIQYLLQQTHQVSVISRTPEKVSHLFSAPITTYSWQQINLDIIKTKTAIINLAGANISSKRWSHTRRQELLDSRITTTTQLAQLCKQLGEKSPALLNASGISIYPFADPSLTKLEIWSETSALPQSENNTILGNIAQLWEAATMGAATAGVRVVNMRFAPVLGYGGGVLKKLLPLFKLGLGSILGSGQQPFPWMALHDAIRAIVFLAQHQDISGAVNLVAPERITQAEFAHCLSTVLHRPCCLRLPASMITLLFGTMGKELLLHGSWVEPKKLQDVGFQFQAPKLITAFKLENIK